MDEIWEKLETASQMAESTGKVGHKPEQEIQSTSNSQRNLQRVGQEQIHDLLFSDKLSWQGIIYDLINTEQLNPWDIDLVILTNRFLEKVRVLEEANFFISSKVLLAAALLLRIKSEVLLNYELPRLDEILSGKKDEDKKYIQERIELDEDVPELIPRTPLPRFRRVSLQELMEALGKAIKTENRRVEKGIILKKRREELEIMVPKHTFNLQDKIKVVYSKLKELFSNREERLAFSELLQMSREDKIPAFVSILHLDTQQRIWLEQEGHFEEIWILLKHLYEKQNKDKLEKIKAEIEMMEKEHETEAIVEKGFEASEDEDDGEDVERFQRNAEKKGEDEEEMEDKDKFK